MTENRDSFFRYLPISQANIDWNLYVTGVGVSHYGPFATYPDVTGHPTDHHFTWKKGRVLGEYQVVYISEGDGVRWTCLLASRFHFTISQFSSFKL